MPLEIDGGEQPTSLEFALRKLDRRYGKSVVRVGADAARTGSPTGIEALDSIIPGGGLPLGRLSWLSGATGAGAFDLSLVLLARSSRSSPVAVVDFDKALDPGDIEDYGGDLDSCWVVRPRHPEEGWAAARSLARAGVEFCLMLAREWRPVGRAAPAALVAATEERNSVVLLGGGLLVPQQIGGRVGIELSCQRLGWTMAHQDVSGLRLRLQVERSHLGPPGQSCQLDIDFPRMYRTGAGIAVAGVQRDGVRVRSDQEEPLLAEALG